MLTNTIWLQKRRKAAEVIPTVDIAEVVSKYITETEKHLDQVFQKADESSPILQYDEADELFGKKTKRPKK